MLMNSAEACQILTWRRPGSSGLAVTAQNVSVIIPAMLDPKFVIDHYDKVRKRLETRGPSFGPLLDEFRDVTLRERENLREIEELRACKNKLSEQIIRDKRAGK
jgi:hypothetical protein